MSQNIKPTNYGALTTLATVFFFWGFIAAGNSVFIPFCKHYFHLDQFQSQLIDFAFYLAYFVGALILFVWGSFQNKDIIGSWGYKKSIVYGLSFSAIGAAVMIISVYSNVFGGMLLGLFIVALGFSVQQSSANPFMIALGDESTGSNRINLGGGINSLGTSIGPLIVALTLFGKTSAIQDSDIEKLSLNSVNLLYAGVGLLFLLVAFVLGTSKKVPAGVFEEKPEKAPKAMRLLVAISILIAVCMVPVFQSYNSVEAKKIETVQNEKKQIEANLVKFKLSTQSTATVDQRHEIAVTEAHIQQLDEEVLSLKQPLERYRFKWLLAVLVVVISGLLFAHFNSSKGDKSAWGAMQYPQLTMGMLAIFIYVGVEVAIGSNLAELLKGKQFGGFTSSETAPFIAMFWGSLMIGRWAGAVTALNLSDATKKWLRLVMPMVAYGVVMFFTWVAGYNVEPLKWYFLCVLIQIIAFYVTDDKPALTLMVFGALGVIATGIGLLTTGMTTVYAFLSAGLCLSIMWPSIFSLSVAGLGKYQSQGSGFLIMMILGGSVLPPFQGKLADIIGIHSSFIVDVVGLTFLTFFAYYVKNSLKKQGISYDEKVSGGGH